MGSLAELLLPSASWYSIFSLDRVISHLLVDRFSLSLLNLMSFRHDFLTSLYKSSLFSSLNLLLCCLSLRDGDKIPFVFKEGYYNICVWHIPSFTHILYFHAVFSHILLSACVRFYNLFIMFFDHLCCIPSCVIVLYFRLGLCMVCRKVQFLVQVHSKKVKLARRMVVTLNVNHEGLKWAQHFWK